MVYTPIVPKNAPPPLAPYSPGVRAGNIVYVSGTLPMAPDGGVIGAGDAAAQTRAVLEVIRSVLNEAGGDLGNIVFNQIFLKDLADYAAMNGVYREFFPSEPPARYCVQAELVRPEYLVEIASIAHL